MNTALMPTSDQTASVTDPSSDKPQGKQITRREFLQYVWGASAALLMVEAGGAAFWFALPHNLVENGVFRLTPSELPLQNTPPVIMPLIYDGFWLRNT